MMLEYFRVSSYPVHSSSALFLCLLLNKSFFWQSLVEPHGFPLVLNAKSAILLTQRPLPLKSELSSSVWQSLSEPVHSP